MSKQAGLPTYQTLLSQAVAQLFDHSDSPRIDAEVLLQHVVDGSMAWLIAHSDTIALPEHIKSFENLVAQRKLGQPIAYLVGFKEFWSLKLNVNQHVLVPRADTETLVEQALNLLSERESPTVLDLGTGSGAIALAVAKELPNAKITAIDASANALEVASHNAGLNSIHNVTFLRSNWFSELESKDFDLIAANPPYVAEGDPHLTKGDLRFEPSLALSANDEGFSDLKTIIQTSPGFLKPGAHLIVEHGYKQYGEIASLFEKAKFRNIHLHNDLNDLPRCTSGALL